MKTINFEYNSLDDIKSNLKGFKLELLDVFVQVFPGIVDKKIIKKIQKDILEVIPNAIISGTTTDGEILSGEVKSNSVVISVSIFNKTKVNSILVDKLNKYNQLDLLEIIETKLIKKDTKCLIVFCDWISSVEKVLSAIYKKYPNIIVSGGKSGDNYNFKFPYLFDNKNIVTDGILISSFSGKDLNVYNDYNFSWGKIGKEMVVTKASGKRIYEIDNMPVIKVYEKYLGKIIADQLPYSGMQFPLILDKKGFDVARDVLLKYDDGSLLLAGGVKVGDKLSFGCGNTDDILSGIFKTINKIENVPIESVFLYSCTARKKFLGGQIISEILPISELFNVSGFFTYGEIYHTKKGNEVLNETLTFLCFSETKKINYEQKQKVDDIISKISLNLDKDKNQFFALSHLLKVTDDELKQANLELKQLNRNLEEKIIQTTSKIKTDQKKYLDGYESIIQNISEMICIINKNKQIIYVNKQFVNIVGRPKQDLIGKQIIDLFLFNLTNNFDFEHFDCSNKTLNLIVNGSKTIPVIIDKTEFLDGGSTLIIKNLKEIQDLKNSYNKLKELDKKKDEFLNIASHELRTPLTTVKGYISLLIEGEIGKVDDEAKNYLQRIFDDSQRLINLINDMLDISKIESGKMEFNYEILPVFKFLNNLIIDIQLLADKKNIDVISDFQLDPGLMIFTDISKFRQVLINILGNAVKFTNNNGKIELISFVLNKKLIIIIKDNGIGIAKDDLPRIFEKFSQVNNSLTRQTGGTGLGLPIALDIVKKLKGKLEVDSEIGIGTTFKITLPLNNINS